MSDQPVPWWATMLVEGWQKCYQWWSVRLAALIVIAPELYEFVPTMKDYISPSLLHHIMGALALLVIVGRIASQPGKDKP